MHEIFIGYSSKHREAAWQLAEIIEAKYGEGSVWRDKELESWGSFETEIRAKAEAASAVVVIWNSGTAASDFVKSEVHTAHKKARLINAVPEGFPFDRIPEPYGIHPVKRLRDTQGILASIASLMRSRPAGPLIADPLILDEESPVLAPASAPAPAPAPDPIAGPVPAPDPGPVYIPSPGPSYGAPPLDSLQDELKSKRHEILPSELLQARYAAVPFQDTGGALAECLAWCRDAAQPAAGRLYYGPGGIGKTRLLIEATAALRETGWSAGFLNRSRAGRARGGEAWQALEACVLHGTDEGVLIVLDRAEARRSEVADIVKLFAQAQANPARPLRLVLLARSADSWWERLRAEHAEVSRLFVRTPAQPDALALPAVTDPAARQALFVESVKKFWPVLLAQGYVKPAGRARARAPCPHLQRRGLRAPARH